MPLAQLGDVQLYYEIDGEGADFLLIHGWNSFLPMWTYVQPHMRQHFRMILPELRGHGRSTELTTHASIEVFAQDLVELLNVLEIDSCIVGGHSLGGFIAQQLALDAPGRVRALILICTGPKIDVEAVASQNWEDQITYGLSLEEAVEKRMKFDFYNPNKVRTIPGMLDLLRKDETQRQAHLVSHGYAATAPLKFNSEERLSEILMPTLILQCAQDPLFPTRVGEFFHTHLPNSTLRIINNTGHSIQLEQPAALVQAIIEFSQSL